MSQTLQDWENDRARGEIVDDIGRVKDLPEIEEPPTTDELRVAGQRPESGWIALAGRINTGLAVQLLWHPVTGDTVVSMIDGYSSRTFPVAGADALDAFYHPFVYAPS